MQRAGFLLVSGLVLGIFSYGSPGPNGRAYAEQARAGATKFEALTQADHAAFGRLGKTLIASARRYEGAKVYYAQPKPYGRWICRVDVINLPGWIVEGRPKPEAKFWEDDLAVSTLYAAWRSPQEHQDADRMTACKDFRQFDRLFYADEGNNPERDIYVLDQLLRAIAKGSPAFKLTCIDKRETTEGRPCDPAKVLRGITIQSPFSAASKGEREVSSGQIHSDTLRFDFGRKHGHPVDLAIEFESKQTYGKQSNSEGDIISARITLEVL